MTKRNFEKGRDKLAERYTKHEDPRTGKRMNSEEAHNHAANVARETEKTEKRRDR
jgi:hypothetical protein